MSWLLYTSTINYIRKNGLAHRQFQQFLEEIEAVYGDVIYFSEVCCFRRGAALKRFLTLNDEINNVKLQRKEKLLSDMYSDVTSFLQKFK